MAEDYSPFDIDVTTGTKHVLERCLNLLWGPVDNVCNLFVCISLLILRLSPEAPTSMTRRTVHIVITSRWQVDGTPMPFSEGAGGAAFVDVFNDFYFHPHFSPGFGKPSWS